LGTQALLVIAILIAAGIVLVSLGRRKGPQIPGQGLYPREGEDTQAEIDRMIQTGHKIQAIKAYQRLYGVSLKEAKDAVDKRRTEIGVT